MKEKLLAEMDMLSVLLYIEKPTIPPLDHALLGLVRQACESISPSITAAFEVDQR